MRIPELSFEGALTGFDYDVAGGRLTLTLAGATKLTGERVMLEYSFLSVFYLQLAGEVPTIISEENGCDEIRELSESELLRSVVVDEAGWTRFNSPLQSLVIAHPPRTLMARHFVVHSSFLHSEWLCEDVDVSTEPFID